MLPVYFHHLYWEIGKSRPITPPPPPSKQCTTGRGLLSVNVLFAMLITVTVLFQVTEQRFLCYTKVYQELFYYFNPVYNIIKVVLLVGSEFGGIHLLSPCSLSATYFKLEHIYRGHYLYSFHAHGTRFSSLSVRERYAVDLY